MCVCVCVYTNVYQSLYIKNRCGGGDNHEFARDLYKLVVWANEYFSIRIVDTDIRIFE